MLTFPALVDHLATVYGEPAPAPDRPLLDLVVLEKMAYLAADAARGRAFAQPRQHGQTLCCRTQRLCDRCLVSYQGALYQTQT